MTTEGEETLRAENKLSVLENEPSKGDVSTLQLVQKSMKEKERRRNNNKRYREKIKEHEKQKELNNFTIPKRRKLSATETAKKTLESISLSYESLLNSEITRIIQFDVKDRIHESKRNFRWVTPCANEKKKILQFQVGNGCFIDVIYAALSNIPNAGYGIFAARDLPKGINFSVYLGRSVKISDRKPNREYTMKFSKIYVKTKKNGNGMWQSVKKNGHGLVIDALMFDKDSKWTENKDLFLGGHLLNDPNFNISSLNVNIDTDDNDSNLEKVSSNQRNDPGDDESNKIVPNCIVQPMLEIVTDRDVNVHEELLICYNR